MVKVCILEYFGTSKINIQEQNAIILFKKYTVYIFDLQEMGKLNTKKQIKKLELRPNGKRILN